jgi:predicted RNA binding protein YcfA (HicA-like mRNA interferase family)
MPRIGPIKRKDLIYYLRIFGFSGPFSGGKHQFMIKGLIRLVIPNPHKGDISAGLLTRILKQAEITKEEWESTK